MTPKAIEIENITKRFFKNLSLPGLVAARFRQIAGLEKTGRPVAESYITALENFSLTIEKGEIFALIGHNGAGKTTLLKILSGLIRPDSGLAAVEGIPVGKSYQTREAEKALKKVTGLSCGEERSFYWRLTGRANLEFFGLLHDLKREDAKSRIAGLAEKLSMTGFLDRRVSDYSTGMRQRLSIARCLIGEPSVILLDDPFRGLDEQTIESFKGLLGELSVSQRRTILITATRTDDIRGISSRIGWISNGRFVESSKIPSPAGEQP